MEPADKVFTKSFVDAKFSAKRDRDPLIPQLMDKVRAGDEMIYGLFINFFNTFCAAGGIEAVLDIICPSRLAAKAGNDIVAKGGYKLPLDAVAIFVAPFKAVKSIALPEVVKPLVDCGKETFLNRIQSIDAKDIKDINKEQIAGSLSAMRDLLRLQFSDEEAAKVVETHEMLLSLKFIQSPFLEKRLQGVGDIRKMIERVEPLSTVQRYITQTQKGAGSWFTAEYLAKWIISNRILDAIFNENVHPELVKRATFVLGFLARRELVSAEIIELLWRSQLEKHEDIVRAVYDAFREILGFLAPEVSFIFSVTAP